MKCTCPESHDFTLARGDFPVRIPKQFPLKIAKMCPAALQGIITFSIASFLHIMCQKYVSFCFDPNASSKLGGAICLESL